MDRTLTLSDESIARRAKKRVETKMGFLIHLLVFVAVNAGLALLQAVQGGDRWNFWPLFGWGIGLSIHGLVVFIGLHSDGLRERLLAAEIERLKARR